MQWHLTLISPGKREHANHAKRNVSIDCAFAQIDAISTHPELPLNLLDHLNSRVVYIL
jgi:hypothetical protein